MAKAIVKDRSTECYMITQLKYGTMIDATEKQTKIPIFLDNYETTGGLVAESQFRMVPANPQKMQGMVIGVDLKKMEVSVKLPDGTIEVIEWVNFLIYIIPKIQTLWTLIKTFFKRRKAKRNANRPVEHTST